MSTALSLVAVPAQPPAPPASGSICRVRVRARWRDDGSVLTVLFDCYGYRHLERLLLVSARGELALHFLPISGSA